MAKSLDALYGALNVFQLPASFPKSCTNAMEVVGKSIEPTITDRSIVGVDFNGRTFQDNKIFILRLGNGKVLIKRFRETSRGIMAVSDNTIKYPYFKFSLC